MATDPAVSEQTLIEGVWFAVEQAGRLLASATVLCDAGDFASGLVMAMFGREELGRSRLLMEAASEVRAGAALSRSDISERCRGHVDKHAAGALSTVLRPAPGDAAYDALCKRDEATLGSLEWDEADAAVHAIADAELEATPKRRHAVRMSSMYVDMTEDGAGWYRPASVDALMARNEVSDAVNDYSVGLQRFNPGYVADMQAIKPRPDLEALHKFKPTSVTLPAPVWPRPFSY